MESFSFIAKFTMLIAVTMVTRLALPPKPRRCSGRVSVADRETRGPGLGPAGTVGTRETENVENSMGGRYRTL